MSMEEERAQQIYGDIAIESVTTIAKHSNLKPEQQAELHKRIMESVSKELIDYFRVIEQSPEIDQGK